ncbi:hypothetical protein [Pedobacter heparinus]|uniref:Uncharacterized protein n=1 Tax=Pedobacter heparinus (strain ATCC 13125 / DSM 2366 / CIP 104194 / JCM 7457 / NBRC 12017 / NCIMB 9290 / NRRL B-14731 / HIM 762-3) TaxID=485917 RepID=C6XWN7_PEDHD|nr:hypothetical protein [Pedobacter heparinus]ACU06326.1 hypothetical protein Phep_4135 [Pedobacter heparinus DSM 2366]
MKKLNLFYVATCIVAICAISAFKFKADTYTSYNGNVTLASLEKVTKSTNGCSYYMEEPGASCWYDSDQGEMEWVCDSIAGEVFCDWVPVMSPTPGVIYICTVTDKPNSCEYSLDCHPY